MAPEPLAVSTRESEELFCSLTAQESQTAVCGVAGSEVEAVVAVDGDAGTAHDIKRPARLSTGVVLSGFFRRQIPVNEVCNRGGNDRGIAKMAKRYGTGSPRLRQD